MERSTDLVMAWRYHIKTMFWKLLFLGRHDKTVYSFQTAMTTVQSNVFTQNNSVTQWIEWGSRWQKALLECLLHSWNLHLFMNCRQNNWLVFSPGCCLGRSLLCIVAVMYGGILSAHKVQGLSEIAELVFASEVLWVFFTSLILKSPCGKGNYFY